MRALTKLRGRLSLRRLQGARATEKVSLAAVILIPAAAALVYLPAYDGTWIWDDDTSVYDNQVVAGPKAGPASIWLSRKDYDYWPLTKTVLWCEWQAFAAGEPAAGRRPHEDPAVPAAFHQVNIMLHALTSLLVYMVLLRLKIPGAPLAGMIYALHPINAFSVVWIAEVKNMLSTIFAAATMLLWLAFRRRGKWWIYVLACLAFALSLAAKTSVVMLPVLLIGLAWWASGRVTWRDLLQTVPLLAMSIGMGYMTVISHQRWFDVLIRPLDDIYRFAGAGWIVWFYLAKILVPVKLSMIYPHWGNTIHELGFISFLPSLALIVVFTGLWLKRRTWWARPLLGALFFTVVMLLPVLGLARMSIMMHTLVANHFLYLPMIGVIALVCAAGWKLAERLEIEARIALGLVAAGVCIALAVSTWRQAGIISAKQSLWEETIAQNEEAWMAHHNLAAALSSQGLEISRQTESLRKEVATLRCKRSVAVSQGRWPDAEASRRQAEARGAEIRDRLAHAAATYAKAMPSYHKTIELQPKYVRAYRNLSVTLLGLDRAERQLAADETGRSNRPPVGRLDEAIQVLQRGADVDRRRLPDKRNPRILMSLGRALTRKWIILKAIHAPITEIMAAREGAVAAYKEAYLLDIGGPARPGTILRDLRHMKANDVALEVLSARAAAVPTDIGALHDLAVVLYETGNKAQAGEYIDKSLSASDGQFARGLKTKGDMFRGDGKLEEAVRWYRRARDLCDKSEHQDELRLSILLDLAKAELATGRYAEALEDFLMGAQICGPSHTDQAFRLRMAEQLQSQEAAENWNRANTIGAGMLTVISRMGNTAEAGEACERALKIVPDWLNGLQRLAWIRAASPDASARDPKRGLECAGQLRQLAGQADPVVLDTLAVALAANGRFADAILAGQSAFDAATALAKQRIAQRRKAEARKYQALAANIRARLSLYAKREPFRHKP